MRERQLCRVCARPEYSPPILHENCSVCGEPATTEVRDLFVPSPGIGSITTKHFCPKHTAIFHNSVAELFDYKQIEVPA